LKNAPFCPISASPPGGISALLRQAQILISLRLINPRNIKYIPACPVGPGDRTGVVNSAPKFQFLVQNAFPRGKLGIFDLTLNKIEHFSKVSIWEYYANIPECPINFPSPGGLVRLRREGMKGRGK